MVRLDSRPPNGVLTLVHSLSTKRHKELHYIDTDEEMVSQIRNTLWDSIFNPLIGHSFRCSIKTLMGQNQKVITSWVDEIGAVSR